MGEVNNVEHEKYPKQRAGVGRRTKVRFWSNLSIEFDATIVRDDAEEPQETIIKLDDGRYVRGTECQYRFVL